MKDRDLFAILILQSMISHGSKTRLDDAESRKEACKTAIKTADELIKCLDKKAEDLDKY